VRSVPDQKHLVRKPSAHQICLRAAGIGADTSSASTAQDNDGWVDRRISFRFPATAKFKQAIVEVMRFPAKADLPLALTVNGATTSTRVLELQKTERIIVPLSALTETTLTLAAERQLSSRGPGHAHAVVPHREH
jgi:hypothetical protein